MTDTPPAVDELLALLGNETRMDVVRTLWEGFDFERYTTESREGTRYSTLFDAAGTDDKGNFNYHLRQLRGTLVSETDEGYVLTPLGYNLMSAIQRYDDFEYVTRGPEDLADPCPFCGGTLYAEYRRELLSVRCRDCPGLAADGNLTFVEVPVTAGRALDLDELLDAATVSLFQKVRSSRYGVCWDCLAPMERSIERCSDHDASAGVCDACDLRYSAAVEASCSRCGTAGVGPLLEYALVDPNVLALHERHGAGPGSTGPWAYRLAAFAGATESVVGTDPVTVAVTFDVDVTTGTVEVTDDDGLAVEWLD